MQAYLPWTEDELVQEISALTRLIEQPADPDDRSANCARSFLREVLKDKRAALAAVRYTKTHREPEPEPRWRSRQHRERGLH